MEEAYSQLGVELKSQFAISTFKARQETKNSEYTTNQIERHSNNSSRSGRAKSDQNRVNNDNFGEINSLKAYSELEVKLDDDAIDKMSPRLRESVQMEIQSYMNSISTKIKEHGNTSLEKVEPTEMPVPEKQENKYLAKYPRL